MESSRSVVLVLEITAFNLKFVTAHCMSKGVSGLCDVFLRLNVSIGDAVM